MVYFATTLECRLLKFGNEEMKTEGVQLRFHQLKSIKEGGKWYKYILDAFFILHVNYQGKQMTFRGK